MDASWDASLKHPPLRSEAETSAEPSRLLDPSVETLEPQIAAERTRLANLEQLLTERERSLSQVQVAVNQRRTSSLGSAATTKRALESSVLCLLQNTNAALERLNAAYEEVLDLTRQRLELAGGEDPREDETLRALLHQLSEREAMRQRYLRERELLQTRIGAWQQVTRMTEPLRRRLEHLQSEIERLRRENAERTAQIAAGESERTRLAAELSSLENEIQAGEQEFHKLKTQRDQQLQRLQGLDEENAIQADLVQVLRAQKQALGASALPASPDATAPAQRHPIGIVSRAGAEPAVPESVPGSSGGTSDLSICAVASGVSPERTSGSVSLKNNAQIPEMPWTHPRELSENDAPGVPLREMRLSQTPSASRSTRLENGASVRRARPAAARLASSWSKQPIETVAPLDLAAVEAQPATSSAGLSAWRAADTPGGRGDERVPEDIETLHEDQIEPLTPSRKLGCQAQPHGHETSQHLSPTVAGSLARGGAPAAEAAAATATATLHEHSQGTRPERSERTEIPSDRIQADARLVIQGECFNNRTLTAVMNGLESSSGPRVRWYHLSRRTASITPYAYRAEGYRYRTTADDVGMRLAAVTEATAGLPALQAFTAPIEVDPTMEERLSVWMLEGRAAFLVRDEASGAPRCILVHKRYLSVQRPAQSYQASGAGAGAGAADPWTESLYHATDDFDPREGHWITEEKKSWTSFIKVALDETDAHAFGLTLKHTFAFRANSAEQRDLIALCVRQFALRYRSSSSSGGGTLSGQRRECRMQ